MTQLFKNDANALLTAPMLTTDLTFTIESSKADKFPVANTGTNPVNTAGLDWFKASIENSSGQIEYVHVRTRTLGSGVCSNVIRAQEGSTALAFAAGSVVEIRLVDSDIQAAIAAPAAYAPLLVPVGGIIMYDGSLASLPANFKVCDGTNGTPDLRDKFVVGVSGTKALTATGGSADAITVAHTHTATFAGSALAAHTHGTTEAPHSHTVDYVTSNSTGTSGPGLTAAPGNDTRNVSPSTTGLTVNAASAGTPAGAVTVASTGASATNANLPPYYALYYIKRVS